MVRTRQTARKSTCGYLPPRVAEFPLEASHPDAYREWKHRREEQEILRNQAEARQEMDDEEQQEDSEEEEDPEEVEPVQSEEEVEHEQQGQEEEQQAAGGAAGGDPEGDEPDDGNNEDDDSDDDEDLEELPEEDDEEYEGHEDIPEVPAPPVAPASPVTPRQQTPPVQRGEGWTVVTLARDGGDDFFHRRLISLLREHHGYGNVAVEYRSEWWTHPRFRNFFRTAVHIRTSNPRLRAAREESVHYALSDRETQEAGIADAARQALYVHRNQFYTEIQSDRDRWYPRRERGKAACRIASTADVTDPQMVSTVALVATLNTELDAALDESSRLRAELAETQARLAVLEHQLGGPEPLPTEYLGESPQRKRTRYGSPSSRTAIDP